MTSLRQAPPTPPVRTRRRGSTSMKRSAGFTAAVLLAPALICVLVLRVIPMIGSLETAFPLGTGAGPWSNFEYLFSDPNFAQALGVTLLFSVIINPLQIALALALAVLLARKLPAVGLWRALVLLPAAVPQTVSAIIWMVFMRPDGPFNAIGAAVGLPPVPWLTSPDFALMSIIIVCSWVGVGFWMTFLITGIKDIPESRYEAASLDGASGWQTFLHITLPGLRRPLLFVLVADTVANLLVFAPVRIMTQGGPSGSTNLVMHYIFETGYTVGDEQTAAAATLILVAIVIVVTAVQFRLLPGKD